MFESPVCSRASFILFSSLENENYPFSVGSLSLTFMLSDPAFWFQAYCV